MNAFRLFLVIGWIAVVYVTARAVADMGASTAGLYFFGDMAHPWRRQFNTDFGFHLLLIGTWMVYRARSPLLGLVWAVLAVTFGAAFTFAYLLIVSVQERGDRRKILIGRHAQTAEAHAPSQACAG